jgi:hypothetical protein
VPEEEEVFVIERSSPVTSEDVVAAAYVVESPSDEATAVDVVVLFERVTAFLSVTVLVVVEVARVLSPTAMASLLSVVVRLVEVTDVVDLGELRAAMIPSFALCKATDQCKQYRHPAVRIILIGTTTLLPRDISIRRRNISPSGKHAPHGSATRGVRRNSQRKVNECEKPRPARSAERGFAGFGSNPGAANERHRGEALNLRLVAGGAYSAATFATHTR